MAATLPLYLQQLEPLPGALDIIRYLNRSGVSDGITVADDLGLSDRSFDKAKRRLVTNGYIAARSDGIMELTQKGNNAARELAAYDASAPADSGSSKIKPSEVARLQEIRSLLIRATSTRVVVEGHTDNVGDLGTNLRLSKERAQSVWQWLKDSDPTGVNINDARLVGVEGYGPYRPLPQNQNSTEAERAANRRVAIILK